MKMKKDSADSMYVLANQFIMDVINIIKEEPGEKYEKELRVIKEVLAPFYIIMREIPPSLRSDIKNYVIELLEHANMMADMSPEEREKKNS